MQIQPYLSFDARCEEALEFYRRALGAEITALVRFKDTPEAHQPKELKNKIMHSMLRVGDTTILASDGQCLGKAHFGGFSLSLTVPDDVAAQERLAALADGGSVTMPLRASFFSSSFGMVSDRFGVSWMVVVENPLKHRE